jgi:hypothetical protein
MLRRPIRRGTWRGDHYPARLGHFELGEKVERQLPALPGSSVVAVG